MKIKGLSKAKEAVDELLENISSMIDNLDPNTNDEKDEMYNDAYMDIDDALELLKDVENLNLNTY